MFWLGKGFGGFPEFLEPDVGTVPQISHYPSRPNHFHCPTLNTLTINRPVTICTVFFNVKVLCNLPTQCICVFRAILATNAYYFSKQHYPVGFCYDAAACSLWGTLFKWTRSPVFTNNKHTLFSWAHFCDTHDHSTPSQTPVWRPRLDVTGTVHFVEGYDGSASSMTIFIGKHTKIIRLLRNVCVP
jgi:hypothetical protein